MVVEEDDQWETDAAVASIGGEALLDMLAGGQIPGATDEGDGDGEPENVVKQEEEIDLEMKFDD